MRRVFLPGDDPYVAAAARDREAFGRASEVLRRDGVRVLAANRRSLTILAGPRPAGTDADLVLAGAAVRPWFPARPARGSVRRLLRRARAWMAGWRRG